MGLVRVTAKVSTLTKRRFFESDFLVDTGALNCIAPATRTAIVTGSALRKIGVVVEGREVFELANGTTVEYPY